MRARERVGLRGDHFDENVVVDAYRLVLLQALGALKPPNGEVDLLGPCLILKSQHFVSSPQRCNPPTDCAVGRGHLQAFDVSAERLRAHWEWLNISFSAPIDKGASVGIV